jgi:4-hydroxythreonine-4-phosphate dehydrogenase
MKPLVITMGDAAGIGPEIILKALAAWPAELGACVVMGDVGAMRRAKSLPGLAELPLALAELHSLDDAAALPPACVGVLQACTPLALPVFGQVSAAAGLAAGAVHRGRGAGGTWGQAAALVTAPIHKEALAAAGLPWSQFPGHTELLQAEAARFAGRPVADMPVRMMLANPELRTVLVSIHVSLAPGAGPSDVLPAVLQTLRITHASLSVALGRPPRMAVAGLNPHAGEGGMFGREEFEVIAPAIEAAQGRRHAGQRPLCARHHLHARPRRGGAAWGL